MMDYWILKNKTPVRVTDDEFSKISSFNNPNKIIAKSCFIKGDENIKVSTVFLHFNHAWDESSKPILFETMIFGGVCNDEQWRYSTFKEAVKGHKQAVKHMLEQEGAENVKQVFGDEK